MELFQFYQLDNAFRFVWNFIKVRKGGINSCPVMIIPNAKDI